MTSLYTRKICPTVIKAALFLIPLDGPGEMGKKKQEKRLEKKPLRDAEVVIRPALNNTSRSRSVGEK